MLNSVLIALFVWTVVVPALVYVSMLLLFGARDARPAIRVGLDLDDVWATRPASACPAEGRLARRPRVARRAHHH